MEKREIVDDAEILGPLDKPERLERQIDVPGIGHPVDMRVATDPALGGGVDDPRHGERHRAALPRPEFEGLTDRGVFIAPLRLNPTLARGKNDVSARVTIEEGETVEPRQRQAEDRLDRERRIAGQRPGLTAGPVAPDCPHPRTDRGPGLPVDDLQLHPRRLDDAHGKRQRRDGVFQLHFEACPVRVLRSGVEHDEKRLRPARKHRPGLSLDDVPRHADGKAERHRGCLGQFDDQVPIKPAGAVERRQWPVGGNRLTIPRNTERPMLLPELGHELAAALLQIGKPASPGGLRGKPLLVDRLGDGLIRKQAADPADKRREKLEGEPGRLPIGLGRLPLDVTLACHPGPMELRRMSSRDRAQDDTDQRHHRGGKELTCCPQHQPCPSVFPFYLTVIAPSQATPSVRAPATPSAKLCA